MLGISCVNLDYSVHSPHPGVINGSHDLTRFVQWLMIIEDIKLCDYDFEIMVFRFCDVAVL